VRAGIVIIGRNEGERLIRCLDSIRQEQRTVVYVDSGSTDDSPRVARDRGIEVVELDPRTPFTAARARNEGLERMLQLHPNMEQVQFLDGDTELIAGWIERAEQEIARYPEAACVFGRNRERNRDASIYNRLCDMEWDTPIGEAEDMGGITMMRVRALQKVGGYNAGMIAGEDTDLALRLRKAGFKLIRVDADMTLHDAAIYHFSQWWTRCVRAGHAFASSRELHGGPPFFHGVRQTRSALFWGLGVPAISATLLVPTLGLSSLGCLGYLTLYRRIYRSAIMRGIDEKDARAYAFFTTLAKFPEALGQLRYWNNRLRGRTTTLIEYKREA
jgi:GT2 family glycosyltransferase